MKKKRKPDHMKKLSLFYLGLSVAASAFWTWIVRLIAPELPLWASVVIFLFIFLLTLGVLSCIVVGTTPRLPELPEHEGDDA